MQTLVQPLPLAEMGTALQTCLMTEQQSKQLEQLMYQLADIVREVDDTELTAAFDQIITYMSHNS